METTTVVLPCTANAYVNSDNPTQNQQPSPSNYLVSAGLSPGSNKYSSFWKFDLSSIPDHSEVLAVELKLFFDSFTQYTSDFAHIQRVDGSWTQPTVTWNNMPAHSTDYPATSWSGTYNQGGSMTWTGDDIKQLVQSWLDGTVTNDGLTQDWSHVNGGAGGWVVVFGRQFSPVGKLPSLTLTYAPKRTKREKILADIKTTLQGITKANGYSVDLAVVSRIPIAGELENVNSPGVFVREGAENPNGLGDKNLTIGKDMRVTIVWWTKNADGDALSSDVNAVYGDIERKMVEDITRGGLAIDTIWDGADFDLADIVAPLGGGAVDYVIRYRHNKKDPTV